MQALLLVQHYIVPPGTAWWWTGIVLLGMQLSLAIIFGRRLSSAARIKFEQAWGVLLLALLIGMHTYRAYTGQWAITDSLPLQLCAMSQLLSIALLLFRVQSAFLPLLFWGLAGGLHALLTPEVTLGGHPLVLAEYFISHTAIIAVPLYYLIVYQKRPKSRDWLRAFVINNLLMIPVGLINFWLDANYMYLSEKPLAENPFVMGDWPWYILGFELAALLHYYLIDRLLHFSHRWRFKQA